MLTLCIKCNIHYIEKSQTEFNNIHKDVQLHNVIRLCKHFNQNHGFKKYPNFTKDDTSSEL